MPVPSPAVRAPQRQRRGTPSCLLALGALIAGMLAVLVLVLWLSFRNSDSSVAPPAGTPTASGPAATVAATSAPTLVAGGGEIFLEPRNDVGPDPFTASVALTAPGVTPEPTLAPTAVPTIAPSPGVAETVPPIQATAGGTVGLYGGTRNNANCDKDQLVAYLEANADKGRAWARIQGIDPSGIRAYVDGLTPVSLRRDIRVTNHGFRNGFADPRQSVLQARTAVLVDARSIPRARCFCGNPLAEPQAVQQRPTYTGRRWTGFSPGALGVIAPAPAPLAAIPVVDDVSGSVFGRTVGTDGDKDVASAAGPSPTITRPGPGKGLVVTRQPAFAADLTPFGAVSSNSIDEVYGPLSGAVDLNVATSWFSKGPHSPTTVTVYEWAVAGPIEIAAVAAINNKDNATPAFRAGYGFGQVKIEVLRNGAVVATVMASLAGNPDPQVVAVQPAGTIGDTVRLSFTGHESLDCGGIGELLVLGPGYEQDLATRFRMGPAA